MLEMFPEVKQGRSNGHYLVGRVHSNSLRSATTELPPCQREQVSNPAQGIPRGKQRSPKHLRLHVLLRKKGQEQYLVICSLTRLRILTIDYLC